MSNCESCPENAPTGSYCWHVTKLPEGSVYWVSCAQYADVVQALKNSDIYEEEATYPMSKEARTPEFVDTTEVLTIWDDSGTVVYTEQLRNRPIRRIFKRRLFQKGLERDERWIS